MKMHIHQIQDIKIGKPFQLPNGGMWTSEITINDHDGETTVNLYANQAKVLECYTTKKENND